MAKVTASEYLEQYVNYGGEWVTVGSLYRIGDTFAGAWLAGYSARGGEFRKEPPRA